MDKPWAPETFAIGLGVAIVSLVCWGSWSNTAKAAEKLAFAYYYLDFSVGVFAAASVAFVTLGGRKIAGEGSDVAYSLHDRDTLYKFLAAVGAGAVFNVANLLLVVAIQIAGLSIAFPVGIGTALVLGTVLTYLIDESGRPEFLFTGVGLGFVAIVAMSMAHSRKDREAAAAAAARAVGLETGGAAPGSSSTSGGARGSETERAPLLGGSGADAGAPPVNAPASGAEQERSTALKLVICVVSGLLMSLWSPLAAYSRDGSTGSLTTYASFLFYTAAVFVTSPVLLALQNRRWLLPRVGPRVRLSAYVCRPFSEHAWGLLGGLIWSVGTLSNLLSGDKIGYAIGYAIGQSAPMVATLWGLLYYREFRGCSRGVMGYLAAMFVFYAGAVGVIAYGGSG